MSSTRVLVPQRVRLTLFTRVNCSLCDAAKHTVTNIHKRRKFEYSEVDVMAPPNKMWKDMYEIDVPVLHVQTEMTEGLSEAKKLFHRFTEQEVEKLIDYAKA
jgi:glutaredoxin